MPRRIWYEFEVVGVLDFPFDMLRYDMCWPTRESEDSGKLQIRAGNSPDRFEPRRIRLTGIKIPTSGRWSSFGWEVDLPTLRKIG